MASLTDLFRRKKPQTAPQGASGRYARDGIITPDEHNPDLVGVSGIDRYEKMWRTDADVRRSLQMVINPIAGATWDVEPAGGEDATAEDVKVAEALKWALFEHMRPRFSSHVYEALRVAFRTGFGPFEKVWELADHDGRRLWVPQSLRLRKPSTVLYWYEDGEQLQGLGQQPPDGPLRRIDARNLVYYRVGVEGNNWEGESLLRAAYKHYVYKEKLELIDAMKHEKYGLGTPIAYVPQSLQGSDLTEFEEALAGLRANEQGYLVVPYPHVSNAEPGQGALVDILTPSGTSGVNGGTDIPASLKYHADKISASVLEEFMRLGQEKVGARATADVQQDPFLAFCEALASVVVEDTVNEQLVPEFVALNFSTDRLPRVSCSLIDSMSVTELATAAQALTGAGLLHPDNPTEDYIRERIDFPAADPKARDKREAEAEEMAKVQKDALAAKGAAQGKDEPDDTKLTLRRQDRPLRAWEQTMSLDRIESVLDDARDHLVDAGRPAAMRLASTYAQQVARGKKPRLGKADPDLTDAIRGELDHLYVTGRETVREELHRQRQDAMAFAEGEADVPPEELRVRAELAAENVEAAVLREIVRRSLATKDQAALQAAGEAAARGALREEALTHASTVLNAGRTDEADEHGDEIRGTYYTSILDGNRCAPCGSADDDVLRPLNDPVRLARVPPNAACSGGERCRCLESYVMADEAAPSA